MSPRGPGIRSDALTLLELEHDRLGKILGVLEDQASAAGAGRPIDLQLVRQSLTYLLEYPDACHHPKEDLIADRIRAATNAPAPATNLREDHETLHDLTARTVDRLRSPDDDPPTLARILREFADAYRQHIAYENSTFFPLAIRTLTQDDFDLIDFRIFDSPDPVFDSAKEERFAVLKDAIVRDVDLDEPAHER